MCAQSQRLSPVDAAWYQMEHPTNLMMITGVLLLRGRMDVERIRATYEARFLQFRRFRQRIVPPALGIGLPFWEDDPHFDIDAHIHHIALPHVDGKESIEGKSGAMPSAAASHEALMNLLADLSSTPLDFSKPLWQMHLVGGVTLEDGSEGSALIMRLHHCIGDGSALVAVAMRLMDTEPDAPLVIPPPLKKRPPRSLLATIAGTATWLLSETRELVSAALQEGTESLSNPGHLLELGATATEYATDSAALLARALAKPNDPLTPLKGKLGVSKSVAWSHAYDLAETKRICAALECKINDVLAGALAGALRTYLLEREASPDGLDISAVIPVDLRARGRELELGNVFGLVFLGLPVGNGDPLLRLQTVKERMDELKRSNEAAFYYALLNLFGMTPRQVEDLAVTYFGTKATTVFTNVVGPRQQIYLAGQPVEQMMFWVPQSGRLALGCSIYSYNGGVTLGVTSDAGIIPDPERIVAAFAEEYALLGRIAEGRIAAAETAEARVNAQEQTAKGATAKRSASRGKKSIEGISIAGDATHILSRNGAQPVQRIPCVALNRDGSQCRNLAREGTAYCYKHAQ